MSAPGNDLDDVITTELYSFDTDFINVSGVETEPLWVERGSIAAIGVRGPNDTLVVLKGSGMQLVAKGIHPNEVIGLVMGSDDAED